jgi:hypothetical protein
MIMAENSGQITIPGLPAEMIEWLERCAADQMTSRAAIVRRLVAQAWKRARDRGERAA